VARLVWKRGGSAADDVVFDLGESPLVVGRDPACAIFINAPLLSREHARVEFRESRHVVIDLGSSPKGRFNPGTGSTSPARCASTKPDLAPTLPSTVD
jgi:pSer/pThr/pTyr-binding forkhead associated (FHA) protein